MKKAVFTVSMMMLATLVTLPAMGQDYPEVRSRAGCAQVELAMAMGDPVSPQDKAACEGFTVKPPAEKPKPEATGDVVFQTVKQEDFKQVTTVPVVKSKPNWLNGKPAEGDLIYGVGISKKREVPEDRMLLMAMQRGMLEIAAQLQVKIDSTLEMEDAEMRSSVTRGGKTKSEHASYSAISESTRMMIQGAVEDARLVDTYKDKGGTLWALMALDIGKIAAREQAVVESVLTMLADAAAAAANALGADQFSQELLLRILDTLMEVRAVERTKIGKKVKGEWSKEYQGLLRLAKAMAECIEVRGGYLSWKDDAGEIQTNTNYLAFAVACNGKVLANAKFTASVDGGFVDLPDVLVTDDRGRGKVKIGKSFGSDRLTIALLHDLSASRGVKLLKKIRTSNKSEFEIRATAKPRANLKVQGLDLTWLGKYGLSDAIAAWLQKKWGAEIVKGNKARLKVTVLFSLNDAIEVNGRYSVPVDLSVTVTGPRGTLFEKSGRHGGLAKTEHKAREQAFKRIVRAMKKW